MKMSKMFRNMGVVDFMFVESPAGACKIFAIGPQVFKPEKLTTYTVSGLWGKVFSGAENPETIPGKGKFYRPAFIDVGWVVNFSINPDSAL
jgi:hypothetical protein